ncbi:MAG TPA: phosphoribosyltransferase [Candidatus Dormibacteraeota bacterium]|nr:phosphoribosyltransferase [Candidatus Dormibacteraeota bacterium]
MVFQDRAEAGRQLAKHLDAYANLPNVIVLGIPRGGVPVAFQVAVELRAPMDVFIVRKLGVPGHEELGFGAIASGGIRYLDHEIIGSAELSDLEIELITAKEGQELARREHAYRAGMPPVDVKGKIVILVDDGIATGASMRVAVLALRQMKPAKIVVAVPVAPASTCRHLQSDVDKLICIYKPAMFWGIGEFYADFTQVPDREVTDLLQQAQRIYVKERP